MFEWYYMLVESDRRATWLFCGECQIAKEIVPWQNLNLKPKIFTRWACFQLFNLPWWQIEVNKAFLGEILPLVKCLQTSNWRKGAQELTLNCKVLKDNFGKMTKLKNDRKCLPSELLNTVFSNPIVAYIWPFIQQKTKLRSGTSDLLWNLLYEATFWFEVTKASSYAFRDSYSVWSIRQLIWFKYRKFKVDCCIFMSRQTSNVAISSCYFCLVLERNVLNESRPHITAG